jgi:hypothetical protein
MVNLRRSFLRNFIVFCLAVTKKIPNFAIDLYTIASVLTLSLIEIFLLLTKYYKL